MTNESNLSKLESSLEKYADSLTQFLKKPRAASKTDVLNMLLARDDLYQEMSTSVLAETSAISPRLFEIDAKVAELDKLLKSKGEIVAATLKLDRWRVRFNRPESSWWWFFEEVEGDKFDIWDRLDWLWDALTLAFLALSASFMISIFKAFSVGDLTVMATFSTIAQLGGLAIVSQGTLTQNGQQKARQLLRRASIPPRFQSASMLILSVVLFVAVYVSHKNLDEYYYDEGKIQYSEGRLDDAEITFLRGLEIDPDNAGFNTELGKIYESLGNMASAVEQYSIGASGGDVASINNLGRVYINKNHPVTNKPNPALAESFLLLGLQRAELTQPDDKDLQYQLNRNVGWAALQQEKYDVAEKFLKRAVALDRAIEGDQTGGGMAYCFLAKTLESQGNGSEAEDWWGECLEHARPETIHEYKWLLDVKQDEFAYCIDTSRVVSGLELYDRVEKDVEECKARFASSVAGEAAPRSN